MGNKDSKDGHSIQSATGERRQSHAAELEAAYQAWTERHGGINESTLERVFGPVLGQKLWRHLKTGLDESDQKQVSSKTFGNRFLPLIFGTGADSWLRLFDGDGDCYSVGDLSNLIHVCRACSGVEFDGKRDEKVVNAVIAGMTQDNDKIGLDQLKLWIEDTCPRFLSSLCHTVIRGLRTATTCCDKWIGPDSKSLSPIGIWLIQCCIPAHFLRLEASQASPSGLESTSNTAIWDLLYSSEQDGLSANRFETKVFNYRSSTVTVIEESNGDCYCLCVDEEWKYSPQRWGKTGCAVYQLHPSWRLLESGSSEGIIYFNLKQRGLPQGMFIGSNSKKPWFSIDADFSNVRSMEVWGCGSHDSFTAQQQHRQWEKRQVEKQQKVPLPGNWEDSPDRMLLEMGGVKTQHAER